MIEPLREDVFEPCARIDALSLQALAGQFRTVPSLLRPVAAVIKVFKGGTHGIQDVGRRAVRGPFCRARSRGRYSQDRVHRPPLGRRRVDRRNRTEDLPVSRGRAQRRRRPERQEDRDRPARQQDQPAGEPDPGAEGRRRGRPHHHPGQRLVGRGRTDRLGVEVQRPQSRQGDPLSQLRGGRSGADQRQVLLLAFPLGCEFRHQDGRADDLHEEPAEHQEGLPDQSGLFLRPCGGAGGAGHAEGEAAGYRDRRR